jgi:uncharacterized protein
MRRWKCLLWLMIVLPYCASCSAAASDSPNKATLKQSNELKDVTLKVPASAGSANLATSYEAGSKAYTEGDVAAAMSFLKPAADAGHAPSQALLAFILDKTLFYDEAVAYYRKSAEQANADGLYGLGVMYSEGSGVKQDINEARRLITSAAEKGHKQAINVIAQAYINGGLGLNEAARQGPEALAWIKRSADNDDLPSIDALAAAYISGQYGLTPDPKKAEAWIAKANKLRGVTAKGGKKKSK